MTRQPKASPAAFRRRKSIDPKRLATLKKLLRECDRLLAELGETQWKAALLLSTRRLADDVELRDRIADTASGLTPLSKTLEHLGISVRHRLTKSRRSTVSRNSTTQAKGQGSRVEGQGRRGGR